MQLFHLHPSSGFGAKTKKRSTLSACLLIPTPFLAQSSNVCGTMKRDGELIGRVWHFLSFEHLSRFLSIKIPAAFPICPRAKIFYFWKKEGRKFSRIHFLRCIRTAARRWVVVPIKRGENFATRDFFLFSLQKKVNEVREEGRRKKLCVSDSHEKNHPLFFVRLGAAERGERLWRQESGFEFYYEQPKFPFFSSFFFLAPNSNPSRDDAEKKGGEKEGERGKWGKLE